MHLAYSINSGTNEQNFIKLKQGIVNVKPKQGNAVQCIISTMNTPIPTRI